MSVLTTYRDAIYEAENTLSAVRARFLKKAGWEHTCDTPGAIWLWRKEFNGEMVVVDASTAIRIEDST